MASRGLDFPNVAYVFNYELPTNIDDYIHRIGRTGRCGNSGKAISFINENNLMLVKDLYNLFLKLNQEIPPWFEQLYDQNKTKHNYSNKYGKQGFTKFNSHNNFNYSINNNNNNKKRDKEKNFYYQNRVDTELTKHRSENDTFTEKPRFYNSQKENRVETEGLQKSYSLFEEPNRGGNGSQKSNFDKFNKMHVATNEKFPRAKYNNKDYNNLMFLEWLWQETLEL